MASIQALLILHRKFGCFGGNEHPPRSVSVSFNIVGFVLRDSEAVKSAIINLPFKTCVRSATLVLSG